jgi:hypothetical protein
MAQTTIKTRQIADDAVTIAKIADRDTDTALSANSDGKLPTQKAVKAYVDAGRVSKGFIMAMAVAL